MTRHESTDSSEEMTHFFGANIRVLGFFYENGEKGTFSCFFVRFRFLVIFC